MISRKVLIFWANQHFDLMKLLVEVGVRNPEEGALIYCPFHHDRNHRSAKVYKDAVHCFAESRQYRPYDILKFLGFSDKKIESTLRVSGNPPEIVYEEKGLNFYDPLKEDKFRFIRQEQDFYTFVDKVFEYIEENTERL